MNLPNKLTVLRVLMVPFFVLFMLTDLGGVANKWIALVDFCGGQSDRSAGMEKLPENIIWSTNFGKFMDPLADKLLVCSAMICLIEKGSTGGMDRDRDHCQRVYYQWIPSGGV